MNDIENLAVALGTALRKALEDHEHLVRTTTAVREELGQLQTERDEMKAQRDALSAEVGRLSGERNRLLRMLGVEEAA
jgi:imidazoleglycerol phosphate dehydratase HisB